MTIIAPCAVITRSDLQSKQGSVEERFAACFESNNKYRNTLPKIEQFYFDRPKTSGQGAIGQAEKVVLTLEHYVKQGQEQSQTKKAIRDAEFLTSRMADREMQIEEVLPLSDGYFYVDKTFVGGGAYVAVLRDLEGYKPCKIVCRGTAGRYSATNSVLSVLNDVQVTFGSMGVRTIWSELSEYLKNKNDKIVQLYGKSLGGAHAQRLALLIESTPHTRVEKLTTVCSVGVDDEIHQQFRQVLSERKKPFEIVIIRNGGATRDVIDPVPLLGGVHLGHNLERKCCKTRIYYIDTSKKISTTPVATILRFITSFKQHCKQVTLDTFSFRKIKASSNAEHLAVDGKIEQYRVRIASLLQCCIPKRVFPMFYK